MLEKGTIIAGYRIEAVLGRGGMGAVYEATQLSLDRTVALKLLAPHLSDDRVFEKRFRREGLLQAAIEHPHIVTVHEAGDSEHGLFLAMRLVRGPTLKDLIVSRELDPGRTLRILGPIADALDAAHEAGLIHRDIKPQNILVGGRDHAYLADFGLTRAPGEESLTRTGQFVGTLDYISPEQVAGDDATARSDIYSLTAVLYECLTGVVPYPKRSDAALLFAHMSEPPPLVTDQRPELPTGLNDVIAAGMAKYPAARHSSAGQLILDAERAFGRRGRAAIMPPGPIETPEELGVRASETEVATQESATPNEDATLARPSRAHARVPSGAAAHEVADPAAAVTAPLPAAVTKPARRRPVPSATLSGLVVLFLAAVVAGLLIGSSASNDVAPATGPNSAQAGGLRLSFPNDWQVAGGEPDIPGLSFAEPIGLAPKRAARRQRLWAGTLTGAAGPYLLPARFLRDALDALPSRSDRVRLGDLEAYRYRRLRVKGLDGDLTLYVAPTTKGVVAVVCMGASRVGPSPFVECERIGATLDVGRARAYPLGPSAEYATTLDRTLDTLNSARNTGRRRMRAAMTPTGQAVAAAGIARAYKGAATTLRRATLTPEVADLNEAVAARIEKAEGAYDRVARAARREDRGAYNRATRAADAAEAGVRRVLGRLGRRGYRMR